MTRLNSTDDADFSDFLPAHIITRYDPPPIPLRQFDWSAWIDGHEPNDNGQMMMGHGATENDAIDDLKDQMEAGL